MAWKEMWKQDEDSKYMQESNMQTIKVREKKCIFFVRATNVE
jgi:hypothetical protein